MSEYLSEIVKLAYTKGGSYEAVTKRIKGMVMVMEGDNIEAANDQLSVIGLTVQEGEIPPTGEDWFQDLIDRCES